MAARAGAGFRVSVSRPSRRKSPRALASKVFRALSSRARPEDGPAAKAGLEPGDVILEFNGQKLSATRQLPRIVAETPLGTKANVPYWRNGKNATTKVEVGELEKAEQDGLLETADVAKDVKPGQGTEIPTMGVTVSSLSPALRESYEIPDSAKGVVVTDVKPGGESAAKGLTAGDVIIEINQQAATDSATAKKLSGAEIRQDIGAPARRSSGQG